MDLRSLPASGYDSANAWPLEVRSGLNGAVYGGPDNFISTLQLNVAQVSAAWSV